ncbi:hypothetical protein G6O69_38190, partial [Pseudenhygromyxa sp. WMMC2535]
SPPAPAARRRQHRAKLAGLRPRRRAQRRASRPALAELVAAATLFAFVVPYYALGRAGYAHAPDALACAWLSAACFAERDGPGAELTASRVGPLLTCAVLMRLQNLLWLLWPVAELLAALRRPTSARPSRAARRLGILCAFACLGLAPQIWLAWAHPGSVRGAVRWDLGFFDLGELHLDLLRVLFGVHGLISWTGIAGLALLGLAWAAWRGDLRARRGALVFAAMILLMACVRDVDGGDAFGARRLAGMVGLLAAGLAAYLEPLRSRRPAAIVFALAVAVATLVNLGRSVHALVEPSSLRAGPE